MNNEILTSAEKAVRIDASESSMVHVPEEMQRVADRYAASRGLRIVECLGQGCQGTVFITNRQSAFKIFERESHFQRERDVYLRLQSLEVGNVLGFEVPKLRNYDPESLIIEMSVVRPPFVLDFAGAYLDRRPEYPEQVMEDWEQQKIEQFEDDWPSVRQLIYAFERFGIYLTDVKPGNVTVR